LPSLKKKRREKGKKKAGDLEGDGKKGSNTLHLTGTLGEGNNKNYSKGGKGLSKH